MKIKVTIFFGAGLSVDFQVEDSVEAAQQEFKRRLGDGTIVVEGTSGPVIINTSQIKFISIIKFGFQF